jgi:hypothetical protein
VAARTHHPHRVSAPRHRFQRIRYQTGIDVTANSLHAKAEGNLVEILYAQTRRLKVLTEGIAGRSGREVTVCHVINCV